MAILNIKNLPDDLYEKLKTRAARERRSVAQEVTVLLAAALDTIPELSIMELRGLGLGVALWKDVDAAAHVETERASWD